VSAKYDPGDLLLLAQRAAHRAGKILMEHFGRIEQIQYKTADSIVTEADLRAENAIRRMIHRACPEHRFFGEECGLDPGRAGLTWVVDPLDGTTNYSAEVPLFAVSIALFEGKRPILGVIYDPVRRRCYWASAAEEGAFRDGRPMHVSRRDLSPTSLAAFGSTWRGARHQKIPRRIVKDYKGRNLGSTVLHLIGVACGQMEFAVVEGIKLWDLAAAGFIVQKAGGRFTDLEGRRWFPLKGAFEDYVDRDLGLVASNGRVHRRVMQEIVSP